MLQRPSQRARIPRSTLASTGCFTAATALVKKALSLRIPGYDAGNGSEDVRERLLLHQAKVDDDYCTQIANGIYVDMRDWKYGSDQLKGKVKFANYCERKAEACYSRMQCQSLSWLTWRDELPMLCPITGQIVEALMRLAGDSEHALLPVRTKDKGHMSKEDFVKLYPLNNLEKASPLRRRRHNRKWLREWFELYDEHQTLQMTTREQSSSATASALHSIPADKDCRFCKVLRRFLRIPAAKKLFESWQSQPPKTPVPVGLPKLRPPTISKCITMFEVCSSRASCLCGFWPCRAVSVFRMGSYRWKGKRRVS